MKLFSEKPLDRLPYLKWMLLLVLLHWLCRLLVLKLSGSPGPALGVMPFVLGTEFLDRRGDATLLGWLLLALVYTWLVTMFSLRRAAQTELTPVAALLCLIPGLQIIAILALCLLPAS